MQPFNAGIYSRLFQPWQPVTTGESPAQTPGHQSDYIELPKVNRYEELENHAFFPEIKSRFLSDILEMKQRVSLFVNHQYDKPIDAFHGKLKSAPEHLKGSLLPLYRETRFQIHQLVQQLKDQQNDPNVDNKDYIASVLHDCLNGIEYCPAGVHSRFSQSFLNLEASRAGLGGKLYKIRSELFHQFIQSFLLEQQREGLINTLPSMEIHWFNSFHNLFCEPLGLAPIVDPMAPTILSDALTRRFLSAAPLSVNACTILRKLSSEWSGQLSETLEKMGVQAWESQAIVPAELTSDRTGILESTLFKPVNHLLKTTEEQSLDLWAMIEETSNGNYHLGRYREKLLAWTAHHFGESSARVFTAIPGGVDSLLHIGTINELFFWVFHHDQRLPAGQACSFEADNHTTLTLPYLTLIDLSTWPETTAYALLTQAMEQTDEAEHIASFFLQNAISEQHGKASAMVVKALSNQLCDKLIKHDDTFKETLCQRVCDHFASDNTTIAPGALDWLTNTPLLKPVLLRLKKQEIDISPIVKNLASWQISDFSHDDIKELLTPNDCQRLFNQAFKRKQAEILSNLLLTGHCDQLSHLLNDDQETPLALFACSGNLPGLEYLLKLGNPEVNQKDRFGWTPLFSAARYGHAACVRALLAADSIDVNVKTPKGTAPLNSAARNGHVACVRALLTAEGIDVNGRNGDGFTPLNCAASYGHVECVRALQTAEGIDVNGRNRDGLTSLNCAARNGHAACVRALLTAEGIDVNGKTHDGLSPLYCAARSGHVECVQALLTAEGIDVNVKTLKGNTPLTCAAREGRVECIKALLTAFGINVNEKGNGGNTPLHFAARYGQVECVEALLNASGIIVNEKNKQGDTPLNFAARYGHTECVKALLKANGILVNEKNKNGITPLNNAAIFGHAGCIRALLTACDIQVNKKTNDGFTPLNCAARHGHAECVTALLTAYGILVNEQNRGGFTPLNSAADAGHTKCVEALLSARGVQVNDKNRYGFTPLHSAALAGHAECVKALLGATGIMVNITSNYKNTPLISSIIFEHTECARLLINDPRTNLNQVNKDMDTALTKARRKRLTEIINLLKNDPRLSNSINHRIIRWLRR
ncbi:ankyrin repeat domain-containing protein [Endozoicomonas sp. SCSIO W0465]|uniref:ankyrin repeat domain-containing protein n=1 Tax=Endozoicomonas sp. SCSIO W0465 TaxID=2918516 RepID=UPI002075A7F8|nr:ankyrin repeat domain-containing protein [Endozoicomonas sp. SCSIO W0465]USE37503.1 ankyrin repeat domain-containing protein [Endozoicomonas sp. SCSIO W0465]